MAREIAPNVVALDDQRIASRNLAPGQRVYDEDLLTIDGFEFRTWNPMKSKLGSYIVKGGRNLQLSSQSTVLYLGAANGTTPSHVSDMVRDGTLVAVEFSPRSFRDLLRMSQPRENIVPVLADAWRPELYERYVGKVDLLFQDIAQRQQAQIFAKNLNQFRPALGILAVKARSVNVAANPRDVYDQVQRDVEALTEYSVVEVVDLGPFEKDHAALVMKPGKAQRREERPPPQREAPREERPRFERRDDRRRFDKPRSGGGGFAPRGDKPRYDRGGGGGGGGFQRRDDDRPRRSGGEWKSRGPPGGGGKKRDWR